MKLERIVIVGAGAVGGSIGARLQLSEHPLALVVRNAHGLAIVEKGLRLKTPDHDLLVHPVCFDSIEKVDWRNGDLALLAVKTQNAKQVMDRLKSCVGSHLPLACASNGIQCELWAAQRFDTVLSILVWMPATHLLPGEVCIHASGSIGVLDVGPHHGNEATEYSDQLAASFRAAGFDAIARGHIKRWKYAKWIANLGNTAQALVTDDWRKIAALAQEEGEAVLTKARVKRVMTQELYDRTAGVRLTKIAGEKRRGGSTWQSHVRGRSLETPYIEGAMADLAASLGVPAPINQFLADVAVTPRELTCDEVLAAANNDRR